MGLFQNDDNVLHEEATGALIASANRSNAVRYPADRAAYQMKVAKAVIVECASRMFYNSLIIDDADKYKASLMPIARAQVVDALSEATDMSSLTKLLKDACPYIKHIAPLVEAVWENHDDIIAENADGSKLCRRDDMYCVMNESNLIIGLALAETDDEARDMFAKGTCHNLLESSNEIKEKVTKCPAFPKNVILDSDDMKLIKAYENTQGADKFAEKIQERVANIFEMEEQAAQDRTNKVQALVGELSNVQETTIEEAVQGGINVISKTPTSLFNAIFMNKSRAVLSESASDNADISEFNEQIMDETICTYTLLETINSLGIHNYTKEEVYHMINEFALA